MNEQIVYVPVSVEDELPPHSFRGFVITIKNDGVVSEKRATFYSEIKYSNAVDKNVWIIDDNWKDEVVTHWLNPTPLSSLLKETPIENA